MLQRSSLCVHCERARCVLCALCCVCVWNYTQLQLRVFFFSSSLLFFIFVRSTWPRATHLHTHTHSHTSIQLSLSSILTHSKIASSCYLIPAPVLFYSDFTPYMNNMKNVPFQSTLQINKYERKAHTYTE